MNSLVLTRWRPDRPTGGAPLRNWQNIRALARLGAVDVASIGVAETSTSVDGVREWTPFAIGGRSTWDNVRRRLWLLRPGVHPSVDLFHYPVFARWLRERLAERRYDVAVIEGISLASYLEDLRLPGCRLVFDAHNVESALLDATLSQRSGDRATILRRLKDAVLRRRMRHAEGRAVLGADVVWACSDHDARQMKLAYGTTSQITVVPNGVEVEAYQQPAKAMADDWPRGALTLVYPGSFAYAPNQDAARSLVTEVLPALRARGCKARIVLVGRNPTSSMLTSAHQDPSVEVTGEVKSVLPYLQQPCVVALPIAVGSGTRLKILESFAAGRPVVSTPKGAEGIHAVDGKHLLIRENPDAIAEAAIELWNRPLLRANLCDNALELVRSQYSWSVVARRIAQSLGCEPRPYHGTRIEPAERPRLRAAR